MGQESTFVVLTVCHLIAFQHTICLSAHPRHSEVILNDQDDGALNVLYIFIDTDLKASLRKLEHESADLKFLNNQYVHKVRALEKESKTKTDRILQLQEKNFHAVVQTPGQLIMIVVTWLSYF